MPHALLLAILVSLFAAIGILCCGRWPAVRELWTFGAASIKFFLVLSLLPAVLAGDTVEVISLHLLPGVSLHLRADPFGTLFALLASGLWVTTSLYSVGYMRSAAYGHQTVYFASFAVCLAATIGLAFAANFFTFFVFYELLTMATYPLVVHDRTTAALAAGRKYLAYTLGAGQLLLLALLWLQQLAPEATFQPGGFLRNHAASGHLTILFALCILGVGVKAAIMPLHGWLPGAMLAPTPVSALLHAVAVVKAGTFGCIRVIHYVFGSDLLRHTGADTVLAILAGSTIVLASLRALGEDNLKRRLAYSTVSQLSYIVLGAALGSTAALAGAMFHMVAHGLLKITLFYCAGAIDIATHKRHISDMAGLGRQMPITFTAFTIGALGLAGMPLSVGFISKWHLGMGALQAGQGLALGILALSGVLNMAYFLPIIYTAFFAGEARRYAEAPVALWLPLAVTASASLLLGIAPNAGVALYHLAWKAAASATDLATGITFGAVP